MPAHITQIPRYKDRQLTMGTFKTQMLWENIRKGDLSASHLLLQQGSINLEERDENGQTFLMLACELGEINIVRELLEANADPNAVDNEKWCALLCAAKEGHLEVVIELLERSADIEYRDMSGWTPLMWACYKGKMLVVQELVERQANYNVKAEFGMSCLAWAAGRGHYDVAKYLVQKGAKVNAADKYGTTPLIWACRKGYLDIVEVLLDAGANVDVVGMNSWTALLVATKGGYTEIVQKLLEHDPNVNAIDKDGISALGIAAKEGYGEIAQELLSKMAYVNVEDKSTDTILIHAVKGGHLEMVRMLINKYAEVDLQGDDNKTALYWAVEKNHNAIVYLLLECDPDLEISNKDGETPLLRAVKNRNEDILRMLLDKKAKVSVVDKRGDSALHISIRARSKKVTELLLRNPRNSRLLYRPNKAGETPYQIDAYHQPKGILSQIYGHTRNLNAADTENLLGYDIYSSALADILSDPSLSTPITVGLYAKWGSGKSFLLGKLQKEMKSFTRANVDEHFAFCWSLFFLLLFINNIIGLTLGLAVKWQIGLGVGLGLFVLEYGFFAAIFFLVRKHNFKVSNNISLMLGKKLRALTLLIKVLFCNPKPNSAKKVDVPIVKYLFSESTRLTSVGGEKALAAMIGTLGDSLESEYGTLVARLFRVFKSQADKSYSGRFKTFCCIPYFVYLYIVLLCLEIGIALLVTYAQMDDSVGQPSHTFQNSTVTQPNDVWSRIEHDKGVLAVLSVFAGIIVLTIFGNIFKIGKAFMAIIWSQKRRVMEAGSKLDVIKLDGLMHRLKYEVDIMAKMVTNMDRFTENQTRLVVVVDGLDSCEQDKVLQVLDTIKTLFCDEDSPFITILAVDPHIIIKGIESNIKLNTSFVDSNVNGFDYLRNVVHLPFYLQSQGMAIPKQTMTKGFSQYDVSGESPVRPKTVQHQESTVSSTTIYDARQKRKSTTRQDSMSLAGTSQFDITGTFTKNDYFSDVNPRSMRRLLNIVAVTGRLLRAYNIDFSWFRLASWINIIEQWPYRTSWIILYYEEQEMTDNNKTLFSIYEKIADKLPVSKEVEPLLEIDRNPRKLEAFLSSKSSSKSNMLTVADLKKFLPCTINLDPYLRKLIRELQKSTDIFRTEFPGYPPPPGIPPTGMEYNTPRRQTLLRNTSAANLLQDRQIPPPITPFGNMPYYSPQFYGMPYMPQINPNTQQNSEKLPSPDAFIKGYNKEILSYMSVQDVCKLLSKLDGLNQNFLQRYQDFVMENNISGRVLVSCELNELKEVLQMKFGDWQLFKSAIKSLINRENNFSARKTQSTVQEESGVNSQSSLNSYSSNKTATSNSSGVTKNRLEKSRELSLPSNGEKAGSYKHSVSQTDNGDDFETIKEHEELVLLNKRSHLSRNDSVVQQMSFESGLLKDAMMNFVEMDEEEEENEMFEMDDDLTPDSSLTSVLESRPEAKSRKTLPVQFSLSEYDPETFDDSLKASVSPKDTEPLLGATASPQPLFGATASPPRKQNHHVSLEEIGQIISRSDEMISCSLSNSPRMSAEKLNLPLDRLKNEEMGKSSDSAGFSVEMPVNMDSIQLVDEVTHQQKQQSLEESVQEFMKGTTQRSHTRSPSSSSAGSSDNIQMITMDKGKDKGPEAFV